MKYYVYLPQSTHVNAHLEAAFTKAFNFITGYITTSVMHDTAFKAGDLIDTVYV